MIKLQTDRLIIRDPSMSDFDGWHRLMSDPKTMYYLDDIMTHSPEQSRANLEDAVTEAGSRVRSKYFFSIEHLETGAFVGSIGYTVTSRTPVDKIVGLGYFLLPEHHGKGYATEALREVLRFAFEEDSVYRVQTGCNIENRASERVMQKCGLIKEAEHKDYTWHDGCIKGRVEYRILKPEWQNGHHPTKGFWQGFDRLVKESELIIDRPKGSTHPRFPDFVYPLDYGYLKGTSSMDGGGIDVWLGSDAARKLDAVMCIVDIIKKDSEIKLLLGCTEEEKMLVWTVHNETEFMKSILIRREV